MLFSKATLYRIFLGGVFTPPKPSPVVDPPEGSGTPTGAMCGVADRIRQTPPPCHSPATGAAHRFIATLRHVLRFRGAPFSRAPDATGDLPPTWTVPCFMPCQSVGNLMQESVQNSPLRGTCRPHGGHADGPLTVLADTCTALSRIPLKTPVLQTVLCHLLPGEIEHSLALFVCHCRCHVDQYSGTSTAPQP